VAWVWGAMNKRTDKKIAIGGVAATAVLVPSLLFALNQTGIGHLSEHPQAAADTPSPGPTTGLAPDQGLPSTPASPTPSTSPSTTPPATYPFNNGKAKPASDDPDLRKHGHGKKPHLPKDAEKLPTSYRKADDGAKITKLEKVSKYQFDVTIATPALAASDIKTRVLVPKSWTPGAKKTWPVIYAYHGGNNRYTSWTKDSNLAQVAADYNVMIVMPEGGWNGSYSNWFNDGKGGVPEWETFHIQEVIPLMERNFHAGASRAAIGLSSGGQGAITYAERHPGLFKYAASYSGPLNITAPGMPTILMQMNAQAGDDIWGNPLTDRSNWEAHDATVMVSRLKGTGVYVSSGNGEIGPYDDSSMKPWDAGRFGEQLAGQMNVNFVRAAQRAGVPITSNLYGPGTHKWAYWKRELVRSWPAIVGAIGAGKS